MLKTARTKPVEPKVPTQAEQIVTLQATIADLGVTMDSILTEVIPDIMASIAP